MTAADTYLKKCKQIVATPNQAFLDCLKEQHHICGVPSSAFCALLVVSIVTQGRGAAVRARKTRLSS